MCDQIGYRAAATVQPEYNGCCVVAVAVILGASCSLVSFCPVALQLFPSLPSLWHKGVRAKMETHSFVFVSLGAKRIINYNLKNRIEIPLHYLSPRYFIDICWLLFQKENFQ